MQRLATLLLLFLASEIGSALACVAPPPASSLAEAAVWADCVLGRSGFEWFAPLHDDRIPLFGPADKGRYCPRRKCASEAIAAASQTLRNKDEAPPERLIALYKIAHIVADVHQPLNATDNNDRGGRDVKVIYLGEASHPCQGEAVPYNLHFVWDTALLANALSGDRSVAMIEELARRHQAEWANGTAEDWARESHYIGADFAYGRLPIKVTPGSAPIGAISVEKDYVDESAPLVRAQLAKASVRLAHVLNQTLAE